MYQTVFGAGNKAVSKKTMISKRYTVLDGSKC